MNKKKFKELINLVWYVFTCVIMLVAMWEGQIAILMACIGWLILDKLTSIEEWLKINASFLMSIKNNQENED